MENQKDPQKTIYPQYGNAIAIGFGILFVLLIILSIETALRFHYNDAGKFFYSFSPELLNHVEMFKRSPIPHAIDPYPRVFCLGGSTTNGCNMPIQYSYPNLLDSIFKKEKKSGSAYNFGISGVNSVTTNFFIKNILPRYKPSCVVIHDGYNDLPIVIKKLGDNKYQYITPDYNTPFNPYIKNPILRYLTSFVKFNLRSIRRFLVTFVKKNLHMGGDLFLGFDYKKYPLKEGTTEDIVNESKKRLKIMLETEVDSVNYCFKNGIKVIIIIEPYIKPYHFVAPFTTGFRDKEVGPILSDCHKLQQTVYLMTLVKNFKDSKDIKILDMREVFKDRYNELFYDECHLNGKGNAYKAQYVYAAIKQLFDIQPSLDSLKKSAEITKKFIDAIDKRDAAAEETSRR